MPPRLYLFSGRSVTRRFQSSHHAAKPALCKASQQRWITADEKPLPTAEQPKGPNQEQLPHVSEEAAAVDKTMGEKGPDLEQGTPVQDILQRDPGAKEKAPKVLQDDMKMSSSPSGSRSYSTSARRSAEGLEMTSGGVIELPPSTAFKDITHEMGGEGHKFGLPKAPLARTDHLKRRYDPMVDQLTKALMRHGKLATAQRTVADILDILRTAPPPQNKSTKPGQALHPTAGPLNLLPLSPIQYLTSVLDSVAPLVKVRQVKGVAGGGKTLPVPVPMGVRLRRRTAIKWILDSADKRIEVKLADRVAREIINVAEGTSSTWEKRLIVHKVAVSSRINVKVMMATPRRR